eukprot:9045411-Pyramimonas_sp.AAC.1
MLGAMTGRSGCCWGMLSCPAGPVHDGNATPPAGAAPPRSSTRYRMRSDLARNYFAAWAGHDRRNCPGPRHRPPDSPPSRAQ